MNIGVRFSKHALKARGTIAMRLSCDTSRKHLTTFDGKMKETNLIDSCLQKKESARGPDGIPYCLHKCDGGLGSKFLYSAYKYVLEGGTIPALFAESTTVFTPQSSDVDNNVMNVMRHLIYLERVGTVRNTIPEALRK